MKSLTSAVVESGRKIQQHGLRVARARRVVHGGIGVRGVGQNVRLGGRHHLERAHRGVRIDVHGAVVLDRARVVRIERHDVVAAVDEHRLLAGDTRTGRPQVPVDRRGGVPHVLIQLQLLAGHPEAGGLVSEHAERRTHDDGQHHQGDHHLDQREARAPGCATRRHCWATTVVSRTGVVRVGSVTSTVTTV